MTRAILIALLCAACAACGGGIDTPDEMIVECSLAQVNAQGHVTCTSRPKS